MEVRRSRSSRAARPEGLSILVHAQLVPQGAAGWQADMGRPVKRDNPPDESEGQCGYYYGT